MTVCVRSTFTTHLDRPGTASGVIFRRALSGVKFTVAGAWSARMPGSARGRPRCSRGFWRLRAACRGPPPIVARHRLSRASRPCAAFRRAYRRRAPPCQRSAYGSCYFVLAPEGAGAASPSRQQTPAGALPSRWARWRPACMCSLGWIQAISRRQWRRLCTVRTMPAVHGATSRCRCMAP